jgi:chromosome segregation ATPase
MDLPTELKLAGDDVATRDDVCRLREELAGANADLAAFLEQRQATAQRERDLRQALHEAHEQLVRRDEELAGALQECLKQQSQWPEQSRLTLERDNALQECLKQRRQCEELSRLSLERHNEVLCLTAEQRACQVYIAALTADRDALLERVQRFRQSFVGFLYRRTKRLGLWR